MSNKPLKKSEQEISWRNKKRKKRKKINPEYHLIICEGTKTEPKYFQKLKEEINQKYSERLQVQIEPSGKGRLEALKEAQQHVKKSLNHISYVWLVYDKDDFPKDEFDNVYFKCKHINEINEELPECDLKTYYYALWSNECIEFWFLLHFIDLKSDIPRTKYISKLNEQYAINKVGRYSKSSDNTYEILRSRLDVAIERAKKIIEENIDIPPSKIKPGTMVHLIFEKLKKYLD